MNKKFIMSYSCGKDSTLALHRMIEEGNKALGLLVTVNKDENRSFFHGVPNKLLEDVSKSLGIDLLLVKCKGEDYVNEFEKALVEAKKNGAEACVFGDIDIEEHRKWCTERCIKVGLEAIFPLWQEEREALTYEFIDKGYKAVIKNIKLDCLDEEFLGKTLIKEVIQDIKKTGSDPCGENGEYHTFVYDGPLFKNEVTYDVNGNIITETHGYLDIR